MVCARVPHGCTRPGHVRCGAPPSGAMDPERAKAIAQRLHAGDRQEDGTPLLAHVRRIAAAVPEEALAVAWLHEALEWTAVTERELLVSGLTTEELRALRLLTRSTESRFDAHYLEHLALIEIGRA